eukprot:NODE_1582_length_805_cov_15.889381_g1533_i0.p1 GENE.NODE_1582_length_805_cov_15.889381_g1533_i0~~NODE_1582_length_805_cov_15.889381_g1533_i0.p1  ORF type:complete len:261 (-),score=52.35 NODE_1582_length_805_cov_15.889381_g1533_i0:5-787(-)
MSGLSGFQKSVGRATTTLMQKAGAVDKTVDKQYEDVETRWKDFERKMETLLKDSKSYLDAIRQMTIAQHRIAEQITLFYDETAVLGLLGLKYKDASEMMDNEFRRNIDAVLRETVLEPLGRFVALFPDIHEAMKKRANKLLDYDAIKTKVRKLAERPSDDAGKFSRVETQAMEAQQVYEGLNNALKTELPILIESRIPYLDPSFEAMVRSQLKFYTDAHNALEPLTRYFDTAGDLSNPEAQVEETLQQMRDLNIIRTVAK